MKRTYSDKQTNKQTQTSKYLKHDDDDLKYNFKVAFNDYKNVLKN